jgi:CDP-glucose 4,6-dehydratase
MSQPFAAFYRGKRVLVTGHTGFAGGWLVAWLKLLGARVCGYGLPPSSRPNFFDATLLDRGMTSIFADVRARDTLANTLADFQPEIIFHAAQSASSHDPVDLYSTNVMGTINLLEEARLTGCVRAMIFVNDSQASNCLTRASHFAAEQGAFAFAESFFSESRTGVAVVHLPTLIGGGDWGQSGLVLALLRSVISGEPIEMRDAIVRRAHVLDAARLCLQLGENLYTSGPAGSSSYEFVPADDEVTSESEFAKKFLKHWGGEDVQIELLKPDSAVPFRSVNNKSGCPTWTAALSLDHAIDWTVHWYKAYSTDPSSAWRTTEAQIEEYAKLPIK